MLAITKASLIATFKSPQAIFFSLFFPVVLIWIFGSLSGNGAPSVDVAFEKGIDTTTLLYQKIKAHPVLHFTDKTNDIEDELRKGRLTAIINIIPLRGDSTYEIKLRTSTASQKRYFVTEIGAQCTNKRYRKTITSRARTGCHHHRDIEL